MTARRGALLAGALTVALLVLTGCAASSGQATSGSGGVTLKAQTATAGPVQVVVTPKRFDGGAAEFTVALDNHQVDLEGDYSGASTLTVAGTRWSTGRWNGAGPGGHHREGTLTFTPPDGSAAGNAVPSGEVVLSLGGLPAPVTLRWSVSSSGS